MAELEDGGTVIVTRDLLKTLTAIGATSFCIGVNRGYGRNLTLNIDNDNLLRAPRAG